MHGINKGKFFLKRLLSILLSLAMIFPFVNASVGAEGSKSLSKNGGYRPYTEWYGASTAGVSRHQIIKVYAYQGETLYFGSSVHNSQLNINGLATGSVTGIDIVMINPTGTASSYNVIQSGAGHIANYAREQAGPRYTANGNEHNPNGYTPLSFSVNMSGVYEFHFHSTLNDSNNPTSTLTNSAFATANTGGTVAAWDVTVAKPVYGNPSNPTQVTDRVEVPGRTYANFLTLNMGGNNASVDMLKSIVYVLTNDGYIYRTDFNGMDPFGFIFFSTNRGLVNANTNAPLYHSVRDSQANNGLANLKADGVEFQNPSYPDTLIDRTYKIFFEMPSSDLPSSILPPKAYAPARVTDFRFRGYTDNIGYVGYGGYFYFNVTNASSATIMIDLSNYTDANGNQLNGGKVVIDNAVVEGENRFWWDGRDAYGRIVPVGVYGENSSIKVTISTKAGEYHFPMLDVENNAKGVKIRLMNDIYDMNDEKIVMTEAERCTIYYNNTTITNSPGLTNVTNPVTGQTGISGNQLNGINSTNGACIFNGSGSNDGGDKCAIDVWTFFRVASTPTATPIPYFELKESNDPLGTIRGLVFFDRNSNGSYSISEGDAPLNGITVNLKDSFGTVIATTKTDIFGNYDFICIPYGNYSVEVVKPNPIYALTTASGGGTETQTIAVNASTLNSSNIVEAKDVGYTYTVADKSLTIDKVWTVSREIDTQQPSSIQAVVTATYTRLGVTTTYNYMTVELSPANNWHVTLNTLPKYHRQGSNDYLITYNVREWTANSRYVSSVTLLESTTEKQFTITNTPRGMIVLTKKDAYNDATLSGAIFELYMGDVNDAINDVLIGTYTTNDDGNIVVDVPIAATYYFKETKAPNGYKMNTVRTTNNIPVTFSSSGSVTYITVTNEKPGCTVTLTKNLLQTSNEDQQFLFELSGSSGNTLYASLVVPKGQTTVSKTILYLPFGTYTVKELNNNWRYSVVVNSTFASNGSDIFNYNSGQGSLSMSVTDPYNTNYTFIFTNRLNNDKWKSSSDRVTNKMVKPS